MNCHNHPGKSATVECRSCGKPLCDVCAQPQPDGFHLCSLCIAAQAAGDLQQAEILRKETQDARDEKRGRRKKIRQWAGGIVILACLAGIAYQVPQIVRASRSEQPVRIGTYATDEKTDSCIANLWSISRDMQAGRIPDKTLRCPSTGQPYRKIGTGSIVVYECPNPSAHHLGGLSVRNRQPIPELRR